MKIIPVEESIGMVLGHDVTEIIPGEFKGIAFKKGHIIKAEDIEKFLNIGKRNIYVLEMKEGILHEDEAAERMAKAAVGPGVDLTDPSEGKVSLKAKIKGLLKINVNALEIINDIDEAMFATLHTDIVVNSGTTVGGTRVIPLVIEDFKIKEIEEICKKEGPIVNVIPFKPMKVVIITTGSEIFTGRIEDKFGPVLKKKVENFDGHIVKQEFVTDDADMISDKIKEVLDLGVDMILITGGMSVDPDDVTPMGIKKAGANIISYGAPTLPGAMFLMAYIDDIPVLGLPGCVMYYKTTVFDLILPKLVAGERIEKSDIRKLGHGGFCFSCKTCTFPNCGFGKW